MQQNPPDCQNGRFLLCKLNVGNGFGSFIHLLGECLLLALGTNRTLMLNFAEIQNSQLFKFLELPFPSCNIKDITSVIQWKGNLVIIL